MERRKKDLMAEDKSTSIRLQQSTKQLLDSLAIGKETHNETIRRLAKNVQNMSAESPDITSKGNVIHTEYNRIRRTFELFTPKGSIEVTCAFNDLRAIASIRSNSIFHSLPSYYCIDDSKQGFALRRN